MGKSIKNLVSVVKLNESIDEILKSASLKVGVADVCKKYQRLLESNREEDLAHDFISEMSKYSNISSINTTLSLLEHRVDDKSQKNNMLFVSTLNRLSKRNPEFYSIVEGLAVDYLTTKTQDSADKFVSALSLYEGMQEVKTLMECVNLDTYARKLGQPVKTMELVNEAEAEVVYTKEQVKEMINKAIVESKKAEEAKKGPKPTLSSLDDMTGLCESINNILAKEGSNAKVKAICEQYLEKVHQGVKPVMLAESFISNMGPYGFLNAVDTELTAMGQRMTKYKQEINLIKVVEMMKQTTSYYIVPLIEEAVVNYVNNKCAPTRIMLRQVCENFMYDKFVRDIMYVVDSDQDIRNLYLGNTIEVHEGVKTLVPFSPVLYITEGEYVFNAFGNYYDRKGNTITKLSKDAISNLNESYKSLCSACNAPGVSFNELTENIEVITSDRAHKAIISEGRLEIDGKEMVVENMKTEAFAVMAKYEGLESFYNTALAIFEGYDTISRIDFAKRVVMNESTRTVDVFRAGDTLGVSLNDNNLSEGATSQYYENVNPIRCKNIINEHMSLKVDTMFEDILPNQKLLESEIADTKANYEAAIEKLNAKKEELKSLKEDSDDEEDQKAIDAAIGVIDQELDDITSNYKDFQKEVDDLNGKEPDKDGENTDGEGDAASAELKSDVSSPLGAEGGEGDVQAAATTEQPEDVTPAEEPTDDVDYFAQISSSYDALDPVLDPVATASDDEMRIQDISYEKNIKTGKTSNNGIVTVMIPTVNPNGDIKNEIKTVSFHLDADRKPVLDNDYMQLSIYNKIIAEIVKNPDTEKVELGTATSSTVPPMATTAAEGEPTSKDLGLGVESAEGENLPTIDNAQSTEEPLPLSATDSTGVPANIDTPLSAQAQIDAAIDGEGEGELNKGVSDVVEKPEEEVGKDEGILSEPISKLDREYVKIEENKPVKILIAADDIAKTDEEKVEFEKYLDASKIKYTKSEASDEKTGEKVPVYSVDIQGKDDAFLVKKYLTKILGYSVDTYYNAYPEMKCYEHANYQKASKIFGRLNEGKAIGASFPYNDELFDQLSKAYSETEVTTDDAAGKDKKIICIADKDSDYETILDIVYDWYKLNKDELDAEYLEKLEGQLKKYSLDVELTVDNTPEVSNFADRNGLNYTEDEDGITFNTNDLSIEEARKVVDFVKSTGNVNESVNEFERLVALNEGYTITIEDTDTKKKITVNTDDIEKDGKTDDEIEKEKKDKEENSDSTHGDDGELFDTKPDATGDQATDNGGDNQNEGCDSDKPAKKKVKFKVKSKKVSESVEVTAPEINSGSKVLYKGQSGQVTGKRADGQFIVVIGGRTIVCGAKDLKLINPDTVLSYYSEMDLEGNKMSGETK